MKILKNILAGTVAIAFAAACNNDGYIDPIKSVAPGDDVTAPVVTIDYPVSGALIRVREQVTPITFQFKAADDVEVKSIEVTLDGTKIAEITDFKDYRNAIASHYHEELTNGPHVLSVKATDLSGKATSSEVTFEKVEPYQPVYDGEIFYMPFDGDYLELVSITEATKVGSPTFEDDAKTGKSYKGANNGYLTFPTAGLLSNEFSAAFWYKVNASPDRSGILVIGPPDPNLPATPNNRKNGFRFFREGGAANQTFKLNVGNGESDGWFDGGAAATLNPTTAGWTHMAFTISESDVKVYINGVVVSQGSFPGVDWTGCDVLSIASGAPRFMEWGHLSDQSLFDELRLFNKALTQAEIQAIIDGD